MALVDEGVIRIDHGSVGGDALPQGGDLAGDRTVTRLGLAGDPGVERGPALSHAQPSPWRSAGRWAPARPWPLPGRARAGSARCGRTSRPGSAGRASCSRRRHAPPRQDAASMEPWAPPSVPASQPNRRCCPDRVEGAALQPASARRSRASTADHSKLNLATLYSGSPPSGAGAGRSPRPGEAPDDDQRQAEQEAGQQGREPVVDPVGEHRLQPRVEPLQPPQQVADPVRVLDVGRVDGDAEQQAARCRPRRAASCPTPSWPRRSRAAPLFRRLDAPRVDNGGARARLPAVPLAQHHHQAVVDALPHPRAANAPT